ncbi:MAG TPA: lytic transglycosylase domain-containing protein [Vicinamibacterales bacterium]
MTVRGFLVLTAMLALSVVPARAEIVFFNNGRNMSIESHRADGDTVVMQMRGGGEMTMDASLIASIEPDEIPHPAPAPVAAEPDLPPAPAVPAVRIEPPARLDRIIKTVAKEQGVDATLVKAVIQVESGFEPRARSSAGAVGLMQVMPQTAKQYGVTGRRLYDPRANIEAGIKHLKSLMDHLPLHQALAAYNAGEGAVQRFQGVPPYPETQKYVSTILALLQ